MADGAERSAGSMHREGRMHESRPEQQQRNFSGQSGTMGRVQGLYFCFFKKRVCTSRGEWGVGSVVKYATFFFYSRVTPESVLLFTTNKSGGGRATAGEHVIHTGSGISYVQRRAERSIDTCSNQVNDTVLIIPGILLLCITVYNQQKRRRASDGGRAMYVHTADTAGVH